MTAVAFDQNGVLYAFSREPAQLTAYALTEQVAFGTPLRLRDSIPPDTRSVRGSGHELFHADYRCVETGALLLSCGNADRLRSTLSIEE